jgi:hypothetical protein
MSLSQCARSVVAGQIMMHLPDCNKECKSSFRTSQEKSLSLTKFTDDVIYI